MYIGHTGINDVFIVENQFHTDNRGNFIKTFHADTFKKNGLSTNFVESFYSTSKKNVIRGMHFQTPPQDHAKLVYVIEGKVVDVALDVRKESPTFGTFVEVELTGKNGKSLYMGKGIAHGYLVLSNTATVVYLTSTMHSPENDMGIRWNSFGCIWRNADNIIMSERDQGFIGMDDYAEM
ncbi:dTDP-4-dehydrorhamnose 3,5-epimerase [Alphaproteobacteria bacterium]|nr:dTDP-4-dehydrorhamnose 3,5-epimerase [Alphaproteobacteria bacterium]